MAPLHKIAILASGTGTNAEAVIRFFQEHPFIQVFWVLTNNPEAGVIHRAANLGIPVWVFNKQHLKDGEVLQKLKDYGITHLVLAGFLMLIPVSVVQAFHQRIINLHPSLLPKHGGAGMYGLKVHEAVKTAGDSEMGITIHTINEVYDEGKILFQARMKVDPTDDVHQMVNKIHPLEYASYPWVIEQWILGNPVP